MTFAFAHFLAGLFAMGILFILGYVFIVATDWNHPRDFLFSLGVLIGLSIAVAFVVVASLHPFLRLLDGGI